MGNFSYVLTELMERKGSVNNEVVRYTGINRSTFFKVKNGTRNPSGMDMVENIGKALRLNAADRQALVKAYEIDQMGAYEYYGVEAIRKFFMSEVRHSTGPAANISIPFFQENEHLRIYRDTSAVKSVILGLLNEKSAKIRIMENRMGDIYREGIPQASRNNPETEFIHIFKLDDTEMVEIDHKLYNVNCFQNVMDIMIRVVNYFPRFYYSPMSVLVKSGQQLNFLISDRFLLTYSEGYESAVLYDDPGMLVLFSDIFENCMSQSACFVDTMEMKDCIQGESYFGVFDDSEGVIYSFCPGICSSLMVLDDDQLIDRYVRDDYPEKGEFVKCFRLYRERLRKSVRALGDAFHMLSAANAVESFAATGYINEFPRHFSTALSREDRVAALRHWSRTAELYNIRTICEKVIPDSSSLCVFVSNRKAAITLLSDARMTELRACVSEPGIVRILYAYLEKLERECVMGKAEFRTFMDGLIEDLI